MKRFTPANRASCIADQRTLPLALRVPPFRCVSEFVLESLANPGKDSVRGEVVAWLVANCDELRAFRVMYTNRMLPQWPLAKNTFNKIVAQTLLGYSSSSPKSPLHCSDPKEQWRYSVPGAVHALRKVQADDGSAGLRAFDHYCEQEPGPWFQLHLLYRLIVKMRRHGALRHLAQPAQPAQADCPVCLKAVEGSNQLWQHLEPCRHWLCDACATEYMQEREQSRCPLCRETILVYVSAVSGK